MKARGSESNFLGIEDPALCSYASSRYVIQSAPYEHTSSYLSGSDKGPQAIIDASHYVEFYDEELDQETFRLGGIATLDPIDFKGKVNKEAVDLIEAETAKLLADNKFVISLGAEHTVTYGFVKAYFKKYPNLSVLQIDAHSDLREAYHDNPYSHASVMARVKDLGIKISQAGIRAQCKEEADLIKASANIKTAYAHQVKKDPNWMKELVDHLSDDVYITIDADGFDPSIVPAVGTAEPNGLSWEEAMNLLELCAKKKNIVGFDIVECAPMEGSILSEFTLARVLYRLLGYISINKK
ncbi:MAG TPA: agmatinase [Bacteroidetes bacterium]|nr:agmatinase [Bacteroidota bacterium]